MKTSKNFDFIFLFIFFPQISFAQELIPDKQFMLGCINVGHSEQVTHYISAAGEVWQYYNGSFITGGVYNDSLVTIGNANFQSADWPGFNFSWLYGGPYWSLGLYKVTNSKQPDKYFYLDSRDSDFGGAVYPPDFFVVFDNMKGVYKNLNLTTIPQGSLISVCQIKNRPPKPLDYKTIGVMF